MSKKLLALAVSALSLGLAAPAMADDSGSVAGQLAEQVAGSEQTAYSNAESTQINPTNTNISVRVLSPGDDGDVTQSNESSAGSFAGNSNDTTQTTDQSQGGAGAVGIQESAQEAYSDQTAVSNADSTQVQPTNRNIGVRVLSPGDNGSVEQSNESKAKSFAGNRNELAQDVTQSQDGSACDCARDAGGAGAVGIQAAGQDAYNDQTAVSKAESTQVKPANTNISVRVLSPGDDGDVKQKNESTAVSGAFNENDTTQTLDQTQGGSRCGCADGIGIQAAGQKAWNEQKAISRADSKQIRPENKSLSVRFKSENEGDGGSLYQANGSFAGSLAANRNSLHQSLTQSQGS